MRRALLAAAFLSAVWAASVAAGGGDVGIQRDAQCDVAARATAGQVAIKYRVRCNYEPSELKLRPSTEVRRAGRAPQVKPMAAATDGFTCEVVTDGKTVQCRGHMEDGATLRGRFQPRGDVCRTSVPWYVGGGVDCDAGEVCIAIGLGDRGTVARPRGC